jgi:hypothetical protein
MARARGRVERRWKLAELPHVVECPVPGRGLRERHNHMHAWCKERCGNGRYATSSRHDRAPDGMPLEFLCFHFGDAATARAFASAFSLRRDP